MRRDFKIKQNNLVIGKVNNNRLRIVVAVIFLLFGGIIFKLYTLQIRQFDFYTAMAASQHEFYNELKPERGKIYLSETVNNEEKLYPVATNKEYAEIFLVPKDVEYPNVMAEKLFDFFDKPKLLAEMAEKQATGTELIIATSTKEEIINNYLKKINKPDDPYEPLVSKITNEELINLYAFLAVEDYSSTSSPSLFSPADLKFKLGRLVYKEFDEESQEMVEKNLKIKGLGFNLQSYRYYPENEITSHIVGYTTNADGNLQGRYGLEEFFNTELSGKQGSLKAEKGNQANLVILNNREYIKAENGYDFVLTIDRNIQFFVCSKLKETVKQFDAEGGTVIVINPKTGEIIAMCSVPDYDPNNYNKVKDISYYNNPATFYQYEPGSVFKTITMAIAIDQNKVSPNTTYNDEGQIMIKGWPKPISNSDFSTHGPHGLVDMNAVLDLSLNTGAIFAMNQVGPKVFAEYVQKFGFGERTGIELGSESPGNISNLLKNKIRDIDAATASFGQGIAVTPLQMVMSYQTIANEGVMMKPHIVKKIIYPNGQEEEVSAKIMNRVVSEKTAATVSAMLVNVVEKGHSKKAAIAGYYVGGKTGTAQIAAAGGYKKNEYVHTFVGIAPIEEPAFVMLTKIDKPVGVQYAEGSALPLWRDIAEFILNYYAVPKTRK